MKKHIALIVAALGSATLFSGCMSGQEAAQLNCALAPDLATVVAIVKSGYAAPANAAAVVGCAAGTAIGASLPVAK